MKKILLLSLVTMTCATNVLAENADPCVTQTNTLEINACAESQLATKDKALNVAYEKLLKSLTPSNKEDSTDYKAVKTKLIQAQRDWIKFRDNDCAAKYDLHASGTIRGLVSVNCKMAHTDQRIKQLETWGEL
jgi:uncharacterized protein YecT (DUF1311 family)